MKWKIPRIAVELCQSILGSSWMSSDPPNFHVTIDPLPQVWKPHTKMSARNGKARWDGWICIAYPGERYLNIALQNYRTWYTRRQGIEFKHKSRHIHIFRKLGKLWAGIDMQTSKEQLEEECDEQRHEPMYFIGEKFPGQRLVGPCLKKTHMRYSKHLKEWINC